MKIVLFTESETRIVLPTEYEDMQDMEDVKDVLDVLDDEKMYDDENDEKLYYEDEMSDGGYDLKEYEGLFKVRYDESSILCEYDGCEVRSERLYCLDHRCTNLCGNKCGPWYELCHACIQSM